MNQKQATVSAIISVLNDKGVNYKFNESAPVAEFLTSDDKSKIVSMICQGFIDGRVEMSQEGKDKYLSNPTELRKYTVGLLNNWMRKAPELNQGFAYQVKNPGSRKGSGDETLKALRELFKITTDATVKSEIQAAIDERLNEIKPKVEINLSALPEHLRHLVK
jgi:hypothetical protein